MNPAHAYRSLLRELRNASGSGPTKINKSLACKFRNIIEKLRESGNKESSRDVQNAITFMRAHREHKRLLERYNPLVDLTAEERIHATARRVGLDMPLTHKPE